jgi:hypothetical protein
MSLFGTSRDTSLIRHLNRELINNIIEQQVGYYKIVLDKTTTNMYGESNGNKVYNDPVLINCLLERTPPNYEISDFGSDYKQDLTVRFLRDDLAGVELPYDQDTGNNFGIYPEVGDVILWQENYYEVETVVENQLFVGKDPAYSYSSDNTDFGSSISIIVKAYYVRPEKLGISQQRL